MTESEQGGDLVGPEGQVARLDRHGLTGRPAHIPPIGSGSRAARTIVVVAGR